MLDDGTTPQPTTDRLDDPLRSGIYRPAQPRPPPRCSWCWAQWVLLGIAVGALLTLLTGCGQPPDNRKGSAQAQAAEDQARAQADAIQADEAEIDAARQEAAAANAEAAANAAAADSERLKTPAAIERAAAARVAAVQAAADARTARAVAAAQRRQADAARAAAATAARTAEAERQAEATAARQERIAWWCAIIGGGTFLVGLAAAAALAYLHQPKAALATAALGITCALAVPLFGASLPWIEAAAPWLLLTMLAGLLAGVAWIFRHATDLRRIIAAPTHDDLPPRLAALAHRQGWLRPDPADQTSPPA